jgi:CDGSH-type Zn-finger protein
MPNEPTDQPSIEVLENGPYRVTGVPLVRLRRVLSDEGGPIDWEQLAELDPGETFDLCRCG